MNEKTKVMSVVLMDGTKKRYSWSVSNNEGAIEVWAEYVQSLSEWIGGVEIHSSKPLYEDQQAIEKCRHTMGKCYCDGTSLYFQDHLKEYFVGVKNPAAEEWLWEIMWKTADEFFEDRFE